MDNKYEPKNVLITGGCGFIGTNLVKYLSEKGCKVRILDKLLTNSIVWQERGKTSITREPVLSTVDLMLGDIRDREIVDKAVDGIDAVVHLAANTGVVDSLSNPIENWDTNVNGTINVLEACCHAGVRKFILASSNAAVGDQTPPIDELKVPQPMSPYGASKLAGEALCSAYYYSFGLNTICLRFTNCYGPYSEHKTSVIAKYINWARQGKPIVIYGDGSQTRDFIHVDDICQAIYLSLRYSESGLQNSEPHIFQVGNGTETSIKQLAELIKDIAAKYRLKTIGSQLLDSQLPTIHKPKRKGEIERNYSDITKAKNILGFEPKLKLREGLEELFSTTLGNGDYKPDNA